MFKDFYSVNINISRHGGAAMANGNKTVHIVGGGTVSHVRSHLAIAAPAYGNTARKLDELCRAHSDKLEVRLHLTRMAGGSLETDDDLLETNEDVAGLLDDLVADYSTKMVFMPVVLLDYSASVVGADGLAESGKYADRLKSREEAPLLQLSPTAKLIQKVRAARKDIFLVGFKTTAGAREDEQYVSGLHLLKEASCNLVLANDTRTRTNMIITPEEARYHTTTNRDLALQNLVEMTYLRSHLTFTRSTIVAGEPVAWRSEQVPEALRRVVDYCISVGAYKPFRGATVGHFAAKVDETTFLTSRRKTNFNDLNKLGLVRIKTDGPDSVLAYGSKPSVGGQSQRIIFSQHPEYDSIVHFHCPIKQGSLVPTVSQREYECGSHECGKNTSTGLARFGDLSAVYLDQHGPNIVFNRTIDPQKVIDFIRDNFDLSKKTGGYV